MTESKKRVGLGWGMLSWAFGVTLYTALYYAPFAVANWSFSPANWGGFSRWTFAILATFDAFFRLDLVAKKLKEENR